MKFRLSQLHLQIYQYHHECIQCNLKIKLKFTLVTLLQLSKSLQVVLSYWHLNTVRKSKKVLLSLWHLNTISKSKKVQCVDKHKITSFTQFYSVLLSFTSYQIAHRQAYTAASNAFTQLYSALLPASLYSALLAAYYSFTPPLPAASRHAYTSFTQLYSALLAPSVLTGTQIYLLVFSSALLSFTQLY